MDIATIRDLYSGPGMDTRQWISYGIVDAETEEQHSTRFDDEDGNPLPHGVLVDVTLQPSGISVPCRVLATAGGSGEGSFSPWGPGDEVLVAIPDGDEKSGCVILGRFNNGKDAFPRAVAGMDVTQNNVSFHRIATPFIMETASSWMVRSAATGASLSIDPIGNVLMADGMGSTIAINQTVISMQEASGGALVQIDPVLKSVTLQSSGGESSATTFQLDDAGGASSLMTGGTMNIVTAGGGYAMGHAITTEQVMQITKALTQILIAVIGTASTAAAPALVAASPQGAAALVALGSALSILSTIEPFSIVSSVISSLSGNALLGGDIQAIAGGLSFPPDPSGSNAGIGRPGFLY